jgi:3'-phosphoadenosine 5'-phosphosulfate sulfotransferase (PAPS reductase)/FAD synthetase
MNEHEFTLADRIQKIKSINELYDLEKNGYVAFSGGKDSTVLHYLLDEALPGNHIPRVYINTGIEYNAVVKFVKGLQEHDDRIKIISPKKNVKEILEQYGYPFKSKEHSQRVQGYKNGERGENILRYFRFKEYWYRQCPKCLMYQIDPNFKLKISKKCCDKLKKEPFKQYEKQQGKTIAITGMLREEGGQRKNITCIVTDTKSGEPKRFHPLSVVTSEFEKWYITERNIKLCELYYPPYNFERTGCKGCPYSQTLQAQLDEMAIYLPAERKQCEYIWAPVYAEYRRIGYRLESVPTLWEQ